MEDSFVVIVCAECVSSTERVKCNQGPDSSRAATQREKHLERIVPPASIWSFAPIILLLYQMWNCMAYCNRPQDTIHLEYR